MVFRNRRRYKFVIVAIAAGVSGIIVIVNVSDSVDRRIGEHLVILGGATIIDIERFDFDSPHPGEFYARDVKSLKRLPHVVEVAPVVSVDNIEAAVGSTRIMVRLAGVDASFWRTIMAHCRVGRLIEEGDVFSGSTYGVLGERIAGDFFGSGDPLGKTIQIDHVNITVIGVLGGIQGPDTLRTVFVPLTTARQRFQDMHPIKHLRVRTDHWKEVVTTSDAIRKLLESSHTGYESGLKVTHHPERIRRVQETVTLVKMLIYLVCTVVIALGGFGTAYLMLASVSERTREIGLKKALGGRDRIVMVQFIIEALIVCLFAGLLGVLLAWVGCAATNTIMGFEIDYGLLFVSSIGGFVASVIVGLLSGAAPAIKANRMTPSEAMRFE